MHNFLNHFCKFTLVIVTLGPLLACSTSRPVLKHENVETKSTAPWLSPGLLNSARIEKKFGSFGVEILSQDRDQGYRLSNLYSLEGGEKIARTIALTTYEPGIHERLKAAHEEIVAGGSIGTTLKKHGFDLKKEIFFKGQVEDMPPHLREMMHAEGRKFASIIYDLIAQAEGVSYAYCTIAEVYSPAFLTMAELQQISPDTSAARGPKNKEVVEGMTKKAPVEKINHIFDQLRTLLRSHR